MKVVFFEEWSGLDHRVTGTTDILRQLADLAEKRQAA
jgi:transcription-repair coupling factor (superfamily II helicase)